jgi:hypothetical protein
MAKEWIDVVDTAVKIGLGGLITGIFTYIGLRFSSKSDKSKYMLEHKATILEKVSSDAEDYFSAWNSFISPISAATKSFSENEEIEKYLPKHQKIIGERDKLLVESWHKKHAVSSKLRLLKASDAVNKFRACSVLEKEIRDALWFTKEYPNHESIVIYRDKVRDSQREFFDALSDYYDELLT